MTTIGRHKQVEDFVCDMVDSICSDGIVCTKELDQNTINSRSACLESGLSQVDDHSLIWKGRVSIRGIIQSRSGAVDMIDKIRAAMPISNKNTTTGIAIYVVWGYSMSPYKVIVGKLPAYLVSISVEITIG